MGGGGKFFLLAIVSLAVLLPAARGFLTGGSGRALSLDGSGGSTARITTSASSPMSFVGQSFTVEFWARVRGVPGPSYAFVCRGANAWCIVRCSGTPGICFDTPGLSPPSLSSRGSLPTTPDHTLSVSGPWRHYAFVLDGTTKRIYVDGSLSSEATVTGSLLAPSGGDTGGVSIGEVPLDGLSSRLVGDVDNVRVWSVARTREQIVASRERAVTTGEPGLLAGVPFDEVPGTAVLKAFTDTSVASLDVVPGATAALVDSGAGATGSSLRLTTGVGAEVIVTLKTDPTASGSYINSLPSHGDLYQLDDKTGRRGTRIAGVPQFVADLQGRVVYYSTALGTGGFEYELRSSDSATATTGSVFVTVQANSAPIAGGSGLAVSLDGISQSVEVDNSAGAFDAPGGALTVEMLARATPSPVANSQARMCLFAITEGPTARIALYLRRDYRAAILELGSTGYVLEFDKDYAVVAATGARVNGTSSGAVQPTTAGSSDNNNGTTASTTAAGTASTVLPVTIASGRWHHFAVTLSPPASDADADSGLARVTIDGVELVPVPSAPLQPARPFAAGYAKKLRLGFSSVTNPITFDADHWHGQVDALRVRAATRSPADLLAFPVERPATATASSFVGSWDFDEFSGTVAVDATGSGRNALLLNGATRVASGAPQLSRVIAPASGTAGVAPQVDFTLPGSDPDGQPLASVTVLNLPATGVGRLAYLTLSGQDPLVNTSNTTSATRSGSRFSARQTVINYLTVQPTTIPLPAAGLLLRFVAQGGTGGASLGGALAYTLRYTVSDGSLSSGVSEVVVGVSCPTGGQPSYNGSVVTGNTQPPAGIFTCAPCAAGTSQSGSGSGQCVTCPAGTYSLGGGGSCIACPAGHVSSDDRKECLPCPAGTLAQLSSGLSQCLPCPAGTHASSQAAVACAMCGRDEYAPVTGSVACEKCPSGMWSRYLGRQRATDLSDCECAEGYYDAALWSTGTAAALGSNGTSTGCAACPSGASCSGGASGPVPLPGYYVVGGTNTSSSASSTGASGNASSTVSVSVPAFAAEGTSLRLYRCPYDASCVGGQQCSTGHGGFLCSKCEEGYSKRELECSKCPANASALFFVVWIALVVVLYLILVAGRFVKEHTRYVPYAGSMTTVGIAVGFVQVTVIMIKYTVGWPGWFRDYLRGISFVSFNLESVAFECMGTVDISAGVERAFRMFVPLIVFAIYVVGFLVGHLWHIVARGMSEGYARKHPAAALPWPGGSLGGYIGHWFSSGIARPRAPDPIDYVNAFTLFLSFAYLWLLESALSVFQCEKQPDGISTWKPDPAVQCYGDTWQKMLAGSAVGLLVYGLGIPGVFAMAMRRYARDYEGDLFVRDEARSRLQSVLWTPFRRGCHYWIQVRTLRKLALAVFIVGLSGWADPRTSLLLSALVVVAAICAQAWLRPYRHDLNNFAEMLSLLATCVLVCCAALYGPDGASTNGGSSSSMGGTGTGGSASATTGVAASTSSSQAFVTAPTGTLSDAIGAVAMAASVAAIVLALYHVVVYAFAVLAKPPSLDEETVDVTMIAENLLKISKRPNAVEAMLNYTSDESRRALIELSESARDAAAAFETMGLREFAVERSKGGPATMIGLKEVGIGPQAVRKGADNDNDSVNGRNASIVPGDSTDKQMPNMVPIDPDAETKKKKKKKKKKASGPQGDSTVAPTAGEPQPLPPLRS